MCYCWYKLPTTHVSSTDEAVPLQKWCMFQWSQVSRFRWNRYSMLLASYLVAKLLTISYRISINHPAEVISAVLNLKFHSLIHCLNLIFIGMGQVKGQLRTEKKLFLFLNAMLHWVNLIWSNPVFGLLNLFWTCKRKQKKNKVTNIIWPIGLDKCLCLEEK